MHASRGSYYSAERWNFSRNARTQCPPLPPPPHPRVQGGGGEGFTLGLFALSLLARPSPDGPVVLVGFLAHLFILFKSRT
jgi:hypothetical protein